MRVQGIWKKREGKKKFGERVSQTLPRLWWPRGGYSGGFGGGAAGRDESF